MPTPNYSENTQQRIADMRLGIRVDRPSAVLTAATVPIFYIHGGNVIMTGFYGEIMGLLDAAAVISLNMDVDTGTDTAIASNSADGNTYVVGRMLSLPAVAGAATWTAECGACPITVAPTYILRPGHIDMACNGGHTTGAMRWSMWYVPMDNAAYVDLTA
jgi:hypothetical protein